MGNQITARDKEVIDFINNFPCTRTTIQAAFFPSSRTCTRRLEVLRKNKLIKAYQENINVDYFYYNRKKYKAPEQRDHLDLVARTFIYFNKLATENNYHLTFEREPYDFPKEIRPDAKVIIENGDDISIAYVEVERSRYNSEIKKKIKKYNKYYDKKDPFSLYYFTDRYFDMPDGIKIEVFPITFDELDKMCGIPSKVKSDTSKATISDIEPKTSKVIVPNIESNTALNIESDTSKNTKSDIEPDTVSQNVESNIPNNSKFKELNKECIKSLKASKECKQTLLKMIKSDLAKQTLSYLIQSDLFKYILLDMEKSDSNKCAKLDMMKSDSDRNKLLTTIKSDSLRDALLAMEESAPLKSIILNTMESDQLRRALLELMESASNKRITSDVKDPVSK